MAHAAPSEYYVATTGDDGDDGSFATPWATITHAAANVTAGDTVYIKAGTYIESEIVLSTSGNTTDYITFRNYSSDIVNIQTPGTEVTSLWTNGKNYIKIIGLRFTGTPTWGINPSGGNHISIQNCYFSNSTQNGIIADNVDYLTISGVEVDGSNTTPNDEAVSLYGCTNFEIKNSIIHDVASAGRCGITIKNGCSNGSVHNNEVYGVTAVGIYVDGEGMAQSNINVYSNNVHDNTFSAGMALNSEVAPATQSNINFYNNLVYNNYSGFAVWATPDFTKTFTLINNTFYHNHDLGDVLIYGAAAGNVGCVVRNNIIVEDVAGIYGILYADYAVGGVTVDHNLFYNSGGAWDASNVLGTNSVSSNPLLTNPVTDFSISSGSPARDVGTSATAPSVDYIGTSRPQGTEFDIGAYEYVVGSGLHTLGTSFAQQVYPIVVVLTPLAIGLKLVDGAENKGKALFVLLIAMIIVVTFLQPITEMLNSL